MDLRKLLFWRKRELDEDETLVPINKVVGNKFSSFTIDFELLKAKNTSPPPVVDDDTEQSEPQEDYIERVDAVNSSNVSNNPAPIRLCIKKQDCFSQQSQASDNINEIRAHKRRIRAENYSRTHSNRMRNNGKKIYPTWQPGRTPYVVKYRAFAALEKQLESYRVDHPAGQFYTEPDHRAGILNISIRFSLNLR